MNHDMKHGVQGILATAGSFSLSLAGVNEVLTCISLLVGIAVGVASFWKIIRSKKTKSKTP